MALHFPFFISSMCGRNVTLPGLCPLNPKKPGYMRGPASLEQHSSSTSSSHSHPRLEWVLLSAPCPGTFKVPEVLAAESGCSPERWKISCVKALFPCSEYFYKANPTPTVSPHQRCQLPDQIFLTGLGQHHAGRWELLLALGRLDLLRAWIWFPQKTLLGRELEVKWKQLPLGSVCLIPIAEDS